MIDTEKTTEFCRPDDWRRFVEYLTGMNRFVLTAYWQRFFSNLVETANKRLSTVEPGTKFFRARIGISWHELESGVEEPHPISPREMGHLRSILQLKGD